MQHLRNNRTFFTTMTAKETPPLRIYEREHKMCSPLHTRGKRIEGIYSRRERKNRIEPMKSL